MARVVTISRHSADDRKGPPQSSPFRSSNPATRWIAALEMVQKRHEEIAGLEKILGQAKDAKTQRLVRQRLLATKNNLQSWEDYLTAQHPKQTRAVITPRAK